MSKIQIEGKTAYPKEKITEQLLNLVKGRLTIIKKEITEIQMDIKQFQSKYSLNDEEFIEKYQNGELGDDQDFFVWKGSIQLLDALSEEEKMLREIL